MNAKHVDTRNGPGELNHELISFNLIYLKISVITIPTS